MASPAYHLRPNKSVDRLLFLECIGIYRHLNGVLDPTYYGFGGPYLEDFRLIYEAFPRMRMVSIEEDLDVFARQKFNRPCGDDRLVLENKSFSAFLATANFGSKASIFWLDYTGFRYQCFDDLMNLLPVAPPYSMIKLTVSCSPGKYISKSKDREQREAESAQLVEAFRQEFEAVLPNPAASPPSDGKGFAGLIVSMVKVAAERAFSGTDMIFQPIASFRYADGVPLLTFTGITVPKRKRSSIIRCFKDWEFLNSDWTAAPKEIDLPSLTTKERLHVQHMLPLSRDPAGDFLNTALGHFVGESLDDSKEKLGQYAEYHRHFPYFMKAVP